MSDSLLVATSTALDVLEGAENCESIISSCVFQSFDQLSIDWRCLQLAILSFVHSKFQLIIVTILFFIIEIKHQYLKS